MSYEKMTLAKALKLLPKFATGLRIRAYTLVALRDAVMQEIEMAKAGENPLTAEQIESLQKFLQQTEGL